MDASDSLNQRHMPVCSSQTPPSFAVPGDRGAVPYRALAKMLPLRIALLC